VLEMDCCSQTFRKVKNLLEATEVFLRFLVRQVFVAKHNRMFSIIHPILGDVIPMMRMRHNDRIIGHINGSFLPDQSGVDFDTPMLYIYKQKLVNKEQQKEDPKLQGLLSVLLFFYDAFDMELLQTAPELRRIVKFILAHSPCMRDAVANGLRKPKQTTSVYMRATETTIDRHIEQHEDTSTCPSNVWDSHPHLHHTM